MQALSLLDLFRWVDHTWVSRTMRASHWGFAAVEIVHLLALAVLGGTLLILTLRVLGLIWTSVPVQTVVRALGPLIFIGIAVMVGSGALLVADGPLRYYANIAFRTKMLLLAGALLCAAFVYRALVRRQSPDAPPAWLRAAAVLSLTLWLGVALAGRVIGVL
jgi:hypothetical protein